MSGLDEALSQDNIPKHLVQVSTEHMFHLLETRLNLKSAWNKQEPKEAAVPTWQSVSGEDAKRLLMYTGQRVQPAQWQWKIRHHMKQDDCLSLCLTCYFLYTKHTGHAMWT